MRFNFIATTILGTTLSVALAAGISAAHASSLVPQQEGEIKLENIPCLDASACIDTMSQSYTVTSQLYDFDNQAPQYGLSRLFVDRRSTENNYGFGIKFLQQDAGTNPPANEYLFRPVAYLADTDTPAENGQLEVGRFLFQFAETVSEVTLDFFDVEDGNFSGIVQLNGNQVDQLLDGGSNGNIQSLTLKDVSSFVVQMGKPGPNSVFDNTGDGVRLSGVTVPEPGMTVSLGVLAIAGLFGLRQRKNTLQVGE